MGSTSIMKATKGSNGNLLRWMVGLLAAAIIGRTVWDAFVADPLNRTTRSSSSTKPARKKSSKFLYEDEPNVIEVTSEEGFFQTSSKPRIVEFYSPYCGHCLNFKKQYVNVANEVHKKYGDDVEFYGVSCMSFHSLCTKYEASSYPTIRSSGKSIEPGNCITSQFTMKDCLHIRSTDWSS